MNRFADKKTVERIRKEYPLGCIVELLKMDDFQAPPVGTKGKVMFVDDIGTIHVAWETGSTLGVAFGVDSCRRTA